MRVDNAVIEILTEECVNEIGPVWVDFTVLPRPISKNAALKKLAFISSLNKSEHLRLRLEDWNTGETEIIE